MRSNIPVHMTILRSHDHNKQNPNLERVPLQNVHLYDKIFSALPPISNGENCIRMRRIHSSEKEVASDLLLEREARYL